MSLQVVAMQDAREAPITLSQPSLSSLFDRQPLERFDAGSAVFWEGDDATHLFQVTDGMLRAVRLLSDGRRIIVGFLRPGDLLGVSLKERYLYTVEAITPVALRRLSRRRFEEEIRRQPQLRDQLFSKLCDEMTAAQDQTVLLSRRSADEKVANFLLMMSRDEFGNCTRIVDIPMTRLDMADYLGMTIETVSRTITKLTNSGIITATGRRSMMVLKMDALRSLADGDDDENWSLTLAAAACHRMKTA
ncbi:hypothetical protein SJ05684_b48020 (plasmid) [Sinorhizobium sojae CCBAU 05684]|uniref:cAMP-binding protein n=1 Tax=Sinorhizobium sojae CCBAU 05684 TaxID=716928 RepID=A0A249PJA9_9HYPH|nr:helix-turn-helix domain-containing protein [Sinorhizobium sojae]ASY65784.1 hypothetical protein SJ05684_b48020 [Sinorhizobium sojae CCBAU 05684]